MSKAAELAALIGSQTAQSNRNLVINGAMNVAQRSTSTTDTTGYSTLDRFKLHLDGFDEAAVTQAQSSDAPSGFSNAFRVDCTTAESALAAAEYSNITYVVEAQDLQQIQNGSSGAKSLTLSFYVKSNKTGTYGLNLYKPDSTARQITATYAISSANTWEYKTITFAGDTAGGGIADDNGAGLYIYWHLAAGSDYTSSDTTSWSNYSNAGFAFGHAVNIYDSNANDFAITGVQLEVGEQATPFEHRSFGDTLLQCQRYLFNGDAQCLGSSDSAGNTSVAVQTPVNLRANPTLVSFSAALRGSVLATAAGAAFSAMVAPRVTITVTNSGTANTLVAGFGGSCSVHLDSEL